MEELMFSVLVCTYNSDWDKTRRTLYSVLMQKKVEFEIVVTDDGSTENNFERIKEYFIKNNFTNYTLVSNSENHGTVRNVLSGLERVKGKYVNPISPGDFLYDENVLKRTYDFILHNYGAAVYFGTAVFYSNENGFLRLYRNKNNPVDLRPYLSNDTEKIKYNYLYNRDYVLGADFLYDKEKWIYYLKELMNFIKYAEDASVIYMVANNETLQFIPFENTWGGGMFGMNMELEFPHPRVKNGKIYLSKKMQHFSNSYMKKVWPEMKNQVNLIDVIQI